MKKIAIVTLMAGFIALLITGCKGKDKAAGGDPKTVLTAFFEKMAKKDIDGAAKLCTKDSKGTMDLMKKGVEAAEKMKGKEGEVKEEDDFKDMLVGDAKIDGDNATVSVTNTKKKETVEFPLKKEDGDWKVDFTMSTLMKMGMDAKKDKGEDLFKEEDITDTTLNELKDLGDTLKQKLDEMKNELKDVMKENKE
ncbi:MAG: DUF4878 domain-containing protein [Chitinophagaceae bacterium]|nr:DUF4878 domain-containing protein [Chitinophagaceae bacterium]